MSEYLTAEIKEKLAKGEFAHFPRQTGKSEALLEFIHDEHSGEAIVICMNSDMAHVMIWRYQKKYPGENVPSFCTGESAENNIRGNSKPVYLEEPHLLPGRAVREAINSGRLAGGVGSQYFAV